MWSEPSGEGFACVLFLVHVSELYFSYILLKRRLLPLSPLSASALHLHVLLRVLKDHLVARLYKTHWILKCLPGTDEHKSTGAQVSPSSPTGSRREDGSPTTFSLFAMSCKLRTGKSD